jgi:hypothetical protein
MEWLWIAALAWAVLAIPLALLIGRYLVRSDELAAARDGRVDRAEPPGQEKPATTSSLDRLLPAAPSHRRRSTPSALLTRAVHPTGREKRASGSASANGITNPPPRSQRRRRPTPHWPG